MKQLLLLLFLSLFLNANAQQQFVYEYKNNRVENHSDKCVLAIDENGSYFNKVNSIIATEYIDKHQTVNQNDIPRSSFWKATAMKTDKKVARYEYLAGAEVRYEFPITDFNWKLTSETKQILGKTLHKATTNYGGRSWVAWYNMEVALQEGPYVFAGLPGLIEEVYDTQRQHEFKLKGAIESNDFYDVQYVKTDKYHRFQLITYNEYCKMLTSAREHPSSFHDMHSKFHPSMYAEVTPEMIKAYNERMKPRLEKYVIECPIE